jgi:hypothetical protein
MLSKINQILKDKYVLFSNKSKIFKKTWMQKKDHLERRCNEKVIGLNTIKILYIRVWKCYNETH